MDFNPMPGEASRSFDMVVMHVDTQTLGEVAAAVVQIRTCNRAPIVLLTEHEPLEWSLAALPAGADAVLSIHTPEEIIVARCMALLRRWFSAS
jgi:DNA-binding NarL/FixJ family response regulator